MGAGTMRHAQQAFALEESAVFSHGAVSSGLPKADGAVPDYAAACQVRNLLWHGNRGERFNVRYRNGCTAGEDNWSEPR